MRRERLTKHNTQSRCLFQPSRRIENNVNLDGGFGLDRTGVLVYLQIPQGNSIENWMSQKSGLMQGKRGVILGGATAPRNSRKIRCPRP